MGRAAQSGPSVRRQLDAFLRGGGLTDADIDALRARVLAPGSAAG